MIHRAFKLVLLAFVATWATGAAHFLHESLDHEDAAANDAMVAAEQSGQPQCYAPTVDDEHECAICSMLATMTATSSVAPQMLASLEPLPLTQPILYRRAEVQFTSLVPPARGPPAAA